MSCRKHDNENVVDTFPPQLDLSLVVSQGPAGRIDANPYDGAKNQPIDYEMLIQCQLVRISKREGKNGKLLKTDLFEKAKIALSSAQRQSPGRPSGFPLSERSGR